jgi:hypothetical protein
MEFPSYFSIFMKNGNVKVTSLYVGFEYDSFCSPVYLFLSFFSLVTFRVKKIIG